MDLRIQKDCKDVDWKTVSETLKIVDMGYHEPDTHKKAFEASYTTIFVYDTDRLIGFGRAISDGVYQAAVYDCAVNPEYQGKGIGKLIIQKIMQQVSNCTVVIYASPGKEGFYQKYGFRKMKTGMALFTKPEKMKNLGFTE